MTLNPAQQHMVEAGRVTRRDVGPCLSCGAKMDAHTDAYNEGASPKPGDVTVCTYCATPMLYGDALQLAPVPAEVARDPDLVRIVRRCAAAAGVEVPEGYR